jgi:hypothetical protein
MNNYPKIYSISTVGIRQHGNADFLLHSVRTDFTGNNGLGKSLIADLLQLIFVPLREEWKPGTEGLDANERKIETIPLSRNWISHAYCFLNIEKSQGKFITVGVYIPTNSRLPVRPFIIQQGANFEDKKVPLKPFDRPLVAADFIAGNLKIYDIKDFSRHLFETFGLYLQDFYQKDGINEYFDWLYKNQILPIDLTRETNLKSFAKVLQSFSKAKTLKITDSKSLQNFLFEDNDEIKSTFENKRDELTRHIRDYHRTDEDIKLLKKKQTELGKLKIIFDRYEESKKNYLLKNANLLWQLKSKAEKEYNDNETAKTNSLSEYNKAKELYEQQCQKLYAKMLEQKAICSKIRENLEKEQSETGTFDTKKLQEQIQKESTFVEKLKTLQPIIDTEKTIEKVKEKFDEQEEIKGKKKKLKALQNSPHFEKFEKSEWIKGYDIAYEYYNNRKNELQKNIYSLKELLSLYDGNNPDSFFNWAINQKSTLSIEQETILMAFKDIYTKQINSNTGKRYSINPQNLVNSFEKEDGGVWVILGDLREHFPLVTKQIFNDKNKLEQALAHNKEQIEKEIKQYEIEQTEIKKLNDALVAIGLNQELIDIYTNRNQIENYQLENLLTEENIQFIEKNFDKLAQIEILSKNVTLLIDRIKKSGELESELKQNQETIDEILESIAKLKSEVLNPIDTNYEHYKSLQKQELIIQRQKYKKEIKKEEDEKNTNKTKKDSQWNTYNITNNKTDSLLKEKITTEKNFATAKQIFEKETFLNFDDQLQMGELAEETVNLAKDDYEQSQQTYWQEFSSVANQFEESKSEKRNPELYDNEGKSNYSYKTLENVLCGKIGLNGVTNELTDLNEKLKIFTEFQMKILTDVFGLVEKQYKEYDNTIRRLNFFFAEQKVSGIYQFNVEFEPRKDINIDWIDKMRERGKVHKDGADLFTLPENLPSAENTPENLIKNIAKTFYRSASADVSQLLNPKFYFTLKVKMEDEAGNKNIGSGGQAYTALALLCIGRLSIVQKNQETRQGVKFIILEELLNIDDTNFNIFPEIAKQYGYQLITMTTKPFGAYTNSEWFLHMLVKGKENKDENYMPMSFFKTNRDRKELSEYELERNKTV